MDDCHSATVATDYTEIDRTAAEQYQGQSSQPVRNYDERDIAIIVSNSINSFTDSYSFM